MKGAVLHTTLLMVVGVATAVHAWDHDEHTVLARRAAIVALGPDAGSELGADARSQPVFTSPAGFSIDIADPIFHRRTFEEASAFAARRDETGDRYHEPGQTVQQQLVHLPSTVIAATWAASQRARRDAWPNGEWQIDASHRNVVTSYLLHHLVALRWAHVAAQAGPDGRDAFAVALAYEAAALSYLSDAFSSSHMRTPVHNRLSRWHRANSAAAHSYYRDVGMYVADSAGDAWQAFGDGVLQWYGPTYDHALAACVTSMRELLLVYHAARAEPSIPSSLRQWADRVSAGRTAAEVAETWLAAHDGWEYYARVKMPALLLIPTPVTATWSIRTAETDVHGMRRRMHYPQLRADGLHDPDTQDIAVDQLYARDAVPDWLVPRILIDHDIGDLIRTHPDVASVRYDQVWNYPPSYLGLLLTVGGSFPRRNSQGAGYCVGIGYGLLNDLAGLRQLSAELSVTSVSGDSPRVLLSPGVGFGVKLPLLHSSIARALRLAESLRVEAGYAWDLRGSPKSDGVRLGIGVQTPTIPLGFTYVGLTFRARYQWVWAAGGVSGVCLDVAVH